MRTLRFSLVLAVVLAGSELAQAGVGLHFGGARGARTEVPFCFAVSATSPWSKQMRGHGGSPGAHLHFSHGRSPAKAGGWLPTGGHSGAGNSHRGIGGLSFKKPRGGGFGQRGDLGIGGNQNSGKDDFGGQSGHTGGGGGDGASADEHVNGSDPFSDQDSYCSDRPRDDVDEQQPADGGAHGGDADFDADCGGLDPSVVPEPTSFVVWALAGTLLIGFTRRTTNRD
jgi:hypothetical protein